MPVYWTQDQAALPDWLMAPGMEDYNTRMAQLTLLLRPAGLKRLQALLTRAGDLPVMVPCHSGWRAMRITTALDVLPKPGGWLKICFDVMFDAPALATMNIVSTDFSSGAPAHGIAANTGSDCAMAAAT
jgi:hypothetical protein